MAINDAARVAVDRVQRRGLLHVANLRRTALNDDDDDNDCRLQLALSHNDATTCVLSAVTSRFDGSQISARQYRCSRAHLRKSSALVTGTCQLMGVHRKYSQVNENLRKQAKSLIFRLL